MDLGIYPFGTKRILTRFLTLTSTSTTITIITSTMIRNLTRGSMVTQGTQGTSRWWIGKFGMWSLQTDYVNKITLIV